MKEIHLLMGYPYCGKDEFVKDIKDPIIDIEQIKQSFLHVDKEKVHWNPMIYKLIAHQLKLPNYENQKIFIKDYLLDNKIRQWFINIAKKSNIPIYLYFFPTNLPYILTKARENKNAFENEEFLQHLHQYFEFPLREEGFDDIIFIEDKEEINI